MKIPSKSWREDDFFYLSLEEVIAIHEEMLKIGGGREGIRDFTLLHSAIVRPKATFSGKLLYPDIWWQAASLLHSLIKNHPFIDGNKRTGYFSTMRFLYINRFKLTAQKKDIISFVLTVEAKKFTLEETSLWLKNHSRKRR